MKYILNYKITKRILYICIFLCLWQFIYLLNIVPEILFPSPITVFKTLIKEIIDGSLIIKTGYTLYLIFLGLLLSFAIAIIFIVLSVTNNTMKDFTKFLISIFDPLPSIALLPIAILWFGVGKASIIFVMVHSILWPTILSITAGFDTIPKIYKEVGNNIGLSKLQLIKDVYIPAALPNILMGIKNGWARAWRALIAAEMIFSAAGSTGGLGWDIYLKRSYFDMPGMFATLIILMFIGILIEDTFFSITEKNTVKKWGMVS